jgi:hypothetical protein
MRAGYIMYEFKLSPETKTILSYFAKLNKSLLFRPGKQQCTVSPTRDVLAVANIEDEIPRQFGIYEIERLLKIIARFVDPILTARDDYLEIKGKEDEYRFAYTAPINILSPNNADVEVDNPVAQFEFTNRALQRLLKVMRTSGHPAGGFVRRNNILAVESFDPTKENLDVYHREISREPGQDFEARFKFHKLSNLIPTDYWVSIGPAWANFETACGTVKYTIASEIEDKTRNDSWMDFNLKHFVQDTLIRRD